MFIKQRQNNIFLTIFILFLVFISYKFASIKYISSDTSYYNQITKQIVRNEKLAVAVENMENRPVVYSQLFFIQNAIFSMFLGEEYYRPVIFFISIFSVLILAHIFGLKKKGIYVLLIPLFSLLYFSSGFFYMVGRYKIEAIAYLLILVYFYIFSNKKELFYLYVLSFLVGIATALKQNFIVFAVFIPLFVFLKTNFSLLSKIKHIILASCVFLAVCLPFYLVIKASTNYFLGVPTMRLPYFDDMNLSIPNVEKNKFYYQSENYVSNLQMMNSINSEDNLFKVAEKVIPQKSFIKVFGISFPLIILFLSIIFLSEKSKVKIIFPLLLIFLALISYTKVNHIWTYYFYANFFIDILLFGFLFEYLIKNKFNKMIIILLLIVVFIPALDVILNSYKECLNANIKFEKLKEAKSYVGDNVFALSNRTYEVGDYLNIKVIASQKYGFDYITDKNPDWDQVNQSFNDCNIESFIESSEKMQINHVILYKIVSPDKNYFDSVKFFENNGILIKVFKNEAIEIYSINNDERSI